MLRNNSLGRLFVPIDRVHHPPITRRDGAIALLIQTLMASMQISDTLESSQIQRLISGVDILKKAWCTWYGLVHRLTALRYQAAIRVGDTPIK